MSADINLNTYYKIKKLCHYNSRQLCLLEITTACYYNSRELLLQFTTGITIHDNSLSHTLLSEMVSY